MENKALNSFKQKPQEKGVAKFRKIARCSHMSSDITKKVEVQKSHNSCKFVESKLWYNMINYI